MTDVDVPGVGGVDKRYVLAAVGTAGAYVVYRWWKARSAPVPAAPGAASADTAPAADAGGGGAYVNPAPGAGGGSASFDAGTAHGSAPTSDQAWTAAITADLTNLGYNPQTVAEALAAYLAHQSLTDAQVTIVRLAWAFEGRPPGEPNLAIVQGGSSPAPAPVPTPTPVPVVPVIPPPVTQPAPGQVAPLPNPPVQPISQPAPVHRYPEYRLSHTNVPGDSYAKIAAEYGTGLSGDELYQYQFSPQAGRPASTQATLRKRGTVIYAGGETEVPYPR